jgi:hypothetical protein
VRGAALHGVRPRAQHVGRIRAEPVQLCHSMEETSEEAASMAEEEPDVMEEVETGD